MTEKKRVLLISPPLDLRGTTIHTRNLIKTLKDKGYEFHVAAAPGPLSPLIREEGGEFHPYPLTNDLWQWLHIPFLRALIKTISPDLIHIRHHSLVRFSRMLLLGFRIPAVLSVSTPPSPGAIPHGNNMIKKIIAISDPLAEELVSSHKVPRDRLVTIRDATFTEERIYPYPRNLSPVVGYMGRLEMDRGIQYIPDIARIVLEKHPDTRFLMVGEGKDDLKARRWIRKSGLSGRVHVVPPIADYRKILRQFFLLLSPAKREGMGIFSLEAMAVARPVIATEVGGAYIHVRDGETGLLAKAEDPEDIAGKVASLVESREKADEMGKKALELVKREFSLENFGKEMDQVYRHVMAPLPQ